MVTTSPSLGLCWACKKPYSQCFCVDDQIDCEPHDDPVVVHDDDDDWTDEDEAALEDYEEDRRRKLAERNEY